MDQSGSGEGSSSMASSQPSRASRGGRQMPSDSGGSGWPEQKASQKIGSCVLAAQRYIAEARFNEIEPRSF